MKNIIFILFQLYSYSYGTFVSNGGCNLSNIKYTFIINNYYNNHLQRVLHCDESCCKVENDNSWKCEEKCCKVLEEKHI
jgi:hypothetical protein